MERDNKQNIHATYWKVVSGFLLVTLLATQIFGWNAHLLMRGMSAIALLEDQKLIETVLAKDGVELPVAWGDMGAMMIAHGVIDEEAFTGMYNARGGLTPHEMDLLYGSDIDTIIINEQNAPFLLNLFWAFGLANKNPILDEGEMVNPQYGGAGNFASTGGWTLSRGDAMDHYSIHPYVTLTDEQQALVERVASGIYRPCCNNSVAFPDCNHGMAMLGLLELLAAQGLNEEELLDSALAVNSYWYPQTYTTIAKYFDERGVAWEDMDERVALGAQYSSGTGYQQLLAQVNPVQSDGGGGCGV